MTCQSKITVGASPFCIAASNDNSGIANFATLLHAIDAAICTNDQIIRIGSDIDRRTDLVEGISIVVIDSNAKP